MAEAERGGAVKTKAGLIITGPKGQAWAEIEIESDGTTIHPANADAALSHALNLYNELPEPKVKKG